MSTTQTGCPMPAMRASDADRDAVLAKLGQHFQDGRLTPEELDERTGRALAARTMGELDELMIDLPVPEAPATGQHIAPRSRGHSALPPGIVALLAVAAVGSVLAVGAGRHGWSVWWIIPVALIAARRLRGGVCPRASAPFRSKRGEAVAPWPHDNR